MRQHRDTGSKRRLAAFGLLAAILTLALAGIGGLARAHHSATSHPARVAANWTDFSYSAAD
jgi:hypothetical protein